MVTICLLSDKINITLCQLPNFVALVKSEIKKRRESARSLIKRDKSDYKVDKRD